MLPTTSIGSFPRTAELRTARADLHAGRIDAAGYEDRVRTEIQEVVSFQERTGLDVLVHGEPERNDMVQYFAEQRPGPHLFFRPLAVITYAWLRCSHDGARATTARPSARAATVSRSGAAPTGAEGGWPAGSGPRPGARPTAACGSPRLRTRTHQ